jgi:hypothetical protein
MKMAARKGGHFHLLIDVEQELNPRPVRTAGAKGVKQTAPACCL